MASDERTVRPRRRLPLYGQVLIGVFLGGLLGVSLGKGTVNDNVIPTMAGDLGLLVIKALKAVAVPLVFFAILDAFVRTRIAARRFGRLALICLVNVSVAMGIALTLINVFKPGLAWRGHLADLGVAASAKAVTAAKPPDDSEAPGATLELIPNVSYYVPSSLVRPFVYGNTISVVLIALIFGAAIRHVREREEASGETNVRTIESFIAGAYQVLLTVLEWVVRAVPFAVFGVVAKVMGTYGFSAFAPLWAFFAVAMSGLLIHSLVYYPLVAWLWGKKPPRIYLGRGADAILTGLSMNSSLATVPVTLRCLERMGVTPASARLAACVGTNLNNDGITLYEAVAALFLTQSLGFDVGIAGQFRIVLASIMAGAGVAGIPEAGFIVLPLVLGVAGLPTETVALALPLLLPVDWIIARARSGVNVMSDMLVAILLDRDKKASSDDSDDAMSRTIDTADAA